MKKAFSKDFVIARYIQKNMPKVKICKTLKSKKEKYDCKIIPKLINKTKPWV